MQRCSFYVTLDGRIAPLDTAARDAVTATQTVRWPLRATLDRSLTRLRRPFADLRQPRAARAPPRQEDHSSSGSQ